MQPDFESQPTDPRFVLPETRIATSTPVQETRALPAVPVAGMPIGEFLLLEELGRGAFGRVFLASQETLNRKVALKITRQGGMSTEEGKALGGLEHDHIVKVYSSFIHDETGWHCLCLQYVAGVDLRTVIERLRDTAPSTGQDILLAIDASGRRDAAFDPSALRDREALAGVDFAQAVCRLGGQLAEALAFAHAKGVMHCDIKPGNILLSPYGRPMLADFNVSFNRTRKADGGLGGTPAYMAPEYAAALQERRLGSVDGRCDIYSLGVVLHELATGSRPDAEGACAALSRVPRELAAIIRRCLEQDLLKRYQTAGELAAALTGAWQILAARRALPRPRRIGSWVIAHPILALALASVIPHLVASIVNITFNAVQIPLEGKQKSAFAAMVLAYNAVTYPMAVCFAVVLFRRVARPLPILHVLDGPAIDDLRRRIRNLGCWAALIGAVGWFPGGVLFPLVIDQLAGPLPGRIYAQFVISFTLSGLIGVIFSYLGVQYVVFRSLFPRVENPDTFTPAGARAEVRPLVAPFGLLVLLASAIPLTGAVLLITFAEGVLELEFRLLMACLIGLGASGVGLAERSVRRIHRLGAVWGGGEDELEAS